MRNAYRYDEQGGGDEWARPASADAVGPTGAICAARTFRNLSAARLCEEAVRRGEGILAASGALVCSTGAHTGRSPQDKYIVHEPATEDQVWWGTANRPLALAHFEALEADIANYFAAREAFVQECSAGADPQYRVRVRVVTDRAWHSLFAPNLLIPVCPTAPSIPLSRLWTLGLPLRSGSTWHSLGRVRCAAPGAAARDHRRHRVCRRDQEIRVHALELPSAGAPRVADALLGQRRSSR